MEEEKRDYLIVADITLESGDREKVSYFIRLLKAGYEKMMRDSKWFTKEIESIIGYKVNYIVSMQRL